MRALRLSLRLSPDTLVWQQLIELIHYPWREIPEVWCVITVLRAGGCPISWLLQGSKQLGWPALSLSCVAIPSLSSRNWQIPTFGLTMRAFSWNSPSPIHKIYTKILINTHWYGRLRGIAVFIVLSSLSQEQRWLPMYSSSFLLSQGRIL